MRKRKQQVMVENVTSSTGRRYFDLIPIDLVIDNILSRFSAKFMAQCSCVLKLWSSIIRHQNYNQLFPIKSSPDPPLRFIFTFLVEKRKLLLFSSPQPQNPDDHSSLVATRYHPKFVETTDLVYKLCRPVGGLVCCQHVGKNYTVAVISNPITGESVTLPKLMKVDIKSKAEFILNMIRSPNSSRYCV